MIGSVQSQVKVTENCCWLYWFSHLRKFIHFVKNLLLRFLIRWRAESNPLQWETVFLVKQFPESGYGIWPDRQVVFWVGKRYLENVCCLKVRVWLRHRIEGLRISCGLLIDILRQVFKKWKSCHYYVNWGKTIISKSQKCTKKSNRKWQ